MQPYLVRFADEYERERQLVGIFVAASVSQLAEMVDECCDIDLCEYAELGPGGIIWEGPAPAVPVTLPAANDEDPPDVLPDASFTDRWWSSVYSADDLCFENLSEALQEELAIAETKAARGRPNKAKPIGASIRPGGGRPKRPGGRKR
ncbi:MULTISPECIES: hypothetical protein [unclassified Beijerinckia]|uniref:hypothetical protein n=1 Tax=unclassified Beijerinckia TaxID=2638183 RepID=UPI0011148B25|nr:MULTISPECIES: hypothetical protein [unclassified Beijerinckia]MDH7797497.1 hypothetical protein [Beijerinckia sp. GAS462]